jgi:hypothetical protein
MRGLARSTLVFLVCLLAASGCLCTGTLDATGGGRLTLRYRVVSALHFEQHKAMLQSPAVTLVSSAMSPDKWVTFELKVADVRALSTAPFLSRVRVDLAEDTPASRRLAVHIDNPAAATMPEVVSHYLGNDFKVSLELPGKVTATNGSGSGGRVASWSLPVAEVASRSELNFTASYQTGG